MTDDQFKLLLGEIKALREEVRELRNRPVVNHIHNPSAHIPPVQFARERDELERYQKMKSRRTVYGSPVPRF